MMTLGDICFVTFQHLPGLVITSHHLFSRGQSSGGCYSRCSAPVSQGIKFLILSKRTQSFTHTDTHTHTGFMQLWHIGQIIQSVNTFLGTKIKTLIVLRKWKGFPALSHASSLAIPLIEWLSPLRPVSSLFVWFAKEGRILR